VIWKHGIKMCDIKKLVTVSFSDIIIAKEVAV